MLKRAIAVGILSTCLGGCLSGRVADLRDVVQVSLHGGLGFSADARLGVLTQPSFGLWSTSFGVGNYSRDIGGLFFHKRISVPYSVGYLATRDRGVLSSLNSTGWDGVYQIGGLQRAFEEIDRPLSTRPPREIGREVRGRVEGGDLREGAWLPFPDSSRDAPVASSFMDWTQFEGGAQVGPFGGRAGFNPLELLDFLLGFGGIDIAGDDDGVEPDDRDGPTAYEAVSGL